MKQVILDLPINHETVNLHVQALLADERFVGLTPAQRRNKRRSYRYRLLGLNSTKRRALRDAAVERQFGCCLVCKWPFDDGSHRPELQLRVTLSEGGLGVADNATAVGMSCKVVANAAVTRAAPSGQTSLAAFPVAEPQGRRA